MRSLATFLVLAAAFGLAVNTANAAAVTVVNADFEDPATILDQIDPVRGDWTMTSVSGWTVTGAAGVFEPIVPGPAYNSLASGTRVGWSNGGSMSQLTSGTFGAGNTYTLTVDIGWRFDTAAFPGGDISIFAGDPATIVGSTALNAAIQGSFIQAVLVLDALDIAPYVGQQIGILLSGDRQQVNFDNVRLMETPVPAAIWLFFSSLAAMFGLKRFRNS